MLCLLVPGIRKLLEKYQLSKDNIDVIDINKAFTSLVRPDVLALFAASDQQIFRLYTISRSLG